LRITEGGIGSWSKCHGGGKGRGRKYAKSPMSLAGKEGRGGVRWTVGIGSRRKEGGVVFRFHCSGVEDVDGHDKVRRGRLFMSRGGGIRAGRKEDG